MSPGIRRAAILFGLGACGLLGSPALVCAAGEDAGANADDSGQPRDVLHAPTAAAAISMLLGLDRVPVATTQSSDPLKAIWEDPTFKKQFIGSYGVNADIEPRFTPEEVKVLEKVRPMMADNLPGAEAELIKAIKGFKTNNYSAILDFTLAGTQFQQEHLPDALANYQKAVGKFPSFRRAWRNLGLIHARNGKYDDAIAAFTRMIELGGGDAYSYGLLGFAYASKQDYQAAEVAYRNAMLLQPQNLEWRLGLTRSVYKQDKFADAASLLNVLIEKYPEKADFWLLQANAYLGMKQPLRAAENLEAVDRLGNASVDSLYFLGDIYLSEALPDLAAQAYQRAMDKDPVDKAPKQPLGRAQRAVELLSSRGFMAQAQQLVEHMQATYGPALEGADRSRLLKLEARLSMAQGAGTAATAKILEEVVALDPLDGEALLMLGQYYAQQKEVDRAMLYYERAESIEAFEAVAKIRHAQVLVGMRRYSDALPLLRRAQEIKPRDDIARYLADVERIARARG